jgi:hypothetical protein
MPSTFFMQRHKNGKAEKEKKISEYLNKRRFIKETKGLVATISIWYTDPSHLTHDGNERFCFKFCMLCTVGYFSKKKGA